MATKKQIAENSLSMEDIIKELNSYKTPERKASFLLEMKGLNLPYKVDWQNLADSYLGNKAWPEKTPQSGDFDPSIRRAESLLEVSLFWNSESKPGRQSLWK